MPDGAVCYVSDENFLFPTIASIMSLRRFVAADRYDIVLFYVGAPLQNIDVVTHRLASMGVKLLTLSDTTLKSIECSNWVGGHVTPAALGRFAAAEYMAANYSRMVYFDGDMFFKRDPNALLEFDPGEDKIAAVDDIRSFARHDIGHFGAETRAYFEDIGVTRDRGYFNSGMFVVRTKSWRMMAADALAYFFANVKLCKLHDQSAMNAVLGERRIPLSLAWNFQTPFKNLLLERHVQPNIYHFTGANKPWFGPLVPWREMFQWFDDAEARFGMAVERPAWSEDRIVDQNKEARFYFVKMHTIFAPRVQIKRREILAYERRLVWPLDPAASI